MQPSFFSPPALPPSGSWRQTRFWKQHSCWAAATAFFSLPYIKGYPAAWRKRFLAWAVLAACYALQGALIVLAMSLWMNLAAKPTQFLPEILMALSCALELALCLFSVLLAWALFRRVPRIVSMPERTIPAFLKKKSESAGTAVKRDREKMFQACTFHAVAAAAGARHPIPVPDSFDGLHTLHTGTSCRRSQAE